MNVNCSFICNNPELHTTEMPSFHWWMDKKTTVHTPWNNMQPSNKGNIATYGDLDLKDIM